MRALMRYPFWYVVGMLLTLVPLCLVAAYFQLSPDEFRALLERHREMLKVMAALNGVLACSLMACLILLTLHLLGVL